MMSEHAEISATAAARVRLDFNIPVQGRPESALLVQDIKEAAAKMITLIENYQKSQAGSGASTARECAIAITHIQTASMFAVFAVTAPAA